MSLSRFFHSISHPNLKRGRSADELQLGRAKSPSSGPEAASRRRGPRASTAPGDPGVRSSSALRNSSLPVAGDVIDETTAADGDVASPQTITLPDAHAADKSDPPPGGALTSTLVVVWDQVKKGSKSTPGGSKLINAAEDKVAGALDVKDAYEPLVSAAATVFEDTGIAQHIEDGIDHFFEGMPVFMNALDAVADVHPFIAVAVMAFKTVYTLEVTRRDNEKKVIALYVEMKDMMAVLLQLHDVRDEKLVAPDKTTIEDRLRALVEKTADDIKACSNACDAYCKKKLLAKVFQGPLWDAKLLSFVDLFEKRRTDIEFALSVHTTETLEAMTAKLSTVDASTKQVNAKLDVLMGMFQNFVSKEQKVVADIVAAKGGAKAVRSNDRLLAALDNAVARASEESGIRPAGPASLDELRDDLMDEPDAAVEKNMAIFSRKFEVQKRQIIDEIALVVGRESDRIIREVKMGAHDRILDKSIHDIWKEMGWRGNVKARHFVLALRDYYLEKMHDESPKIKGISTVKNDKTDADAWAIKFIDVLHLQRILEACDDDASGFITVGEMNRFTSSRPIDWSLPHWIAFWSIGWRSTIINYAKKIELLFSKMEAVHAKLLPANRRLVDQYDSWVWAAVHLLSATVKNDKAGPHQDKFAKYVEAEENRLRENLKAVDYFIDESNTLTLIAGNGRIEKTAFPLFYLLLERHYEIMKIGTRKIISPREFIEAGISIVHVSNALRFRTRDLRNIFAQQKLDVAKHFESFACGVLKYFYKEADLWTPEYLMSLGSNVVPYDGSKEDMKPEEILRFPCSDELALDFSAYQTNLESDEQDAVEAGTAIASPLKDVLGRWCGAHFLESTESGRVGETLQAISLTAGDGERSIKGTGYSNKGHFNIEGSCSTNAEGATEVSFTLTFGGTHWTKIVFHGTICRDSNSMSGNYGAARTPGENLGLLVYKRNMAPEYVAFYPSPWSLRENKARALWTFAIESIRHDIRRARWSWAYFKERRDTWKVYSTFCMRLLYCGTPLTEEEKVQLGNMGLRILPSDACLYGSRIERIKATTAIHENGWCDVCGGCIGGARLVCLDCDFKKDNAFNTLDTCDVERCVNSVVSTEKRGDLAAPHLPTHHVYKARTTILRRQLGKLDRKAREGLKAVEPLCVLLAARKAAGEATTAASASQQPKALAPPAPRPISQASKRLSTATTATKVEEDSVPCCGVCTQTLTLPCWYCLHCNRDKLYICKSCDDKGVPKLKDRPEHTEEHALVRCQVPTPTEEKVTVEQRLAVLENRIGNLDDRMGNIEGRIGNIEQVLLHVAEVLKSENKAA